MPACDVDVRFNGLGEKIIGTGCRFQRIRRITGYLVGTIDRFNNAKKAEVLDRVRHMDCACHMGLAARLQRQNAARLAAKKAA